jgi:hypothetical protein
MEILTGLGLGWICLVLGLVLFIPACWLAYKGGAAVGTSIGSFLGAIAARIFDSFD